MALEVVTSRTMKERQLKLIYMTVVVKLEAVLTTKVVKMNTRRGSTSEGLQDNV